MWLRFPDAWPDGVVIVMALVALTALDIVGSAAAREAVDAGVDAAAWKWVLAGVVVNVVMWWVLASTLLRGSLTVIMLGWCIAAQIGVLALDRVRYGVRLTAPQWAAVVVIISAQVFLMSAPGAGKDAAQRPASLAQLLTTGSSSAPISPPTVSLFTPTRTSGHLPPMVPLEVPDPGFAVQPGRWASPPARERSPKHRSLYASPSRAVPGAGADPARTGVRANGRVEQDKSLLTSRSR
jgi:hypothetical protein